MTAQRRRLFSGIFHRSLIFIFTPSLAGSEWRTELIRQTGNKKPAQGGFISLSAELICSGYRLHRYCKRR
jgi:hypothetical protein